MNWEKLKCLARETFKNLKIFLLIGKNLEVEPKSNTQNPNFNWWMNWENACPNLSFPIENKLSNLHKLRLLLFQT